MREILFRGKTESSEWVYGYLSASRLNTYPDGFEIISVDGINYDELDGYMPDFISHGVIPETVGQYTGLTDKTGKKIFEGDICQIKGISYIDETPFVVEWNNEYSGWFWKDLNITPATDTITPHIAKTAKVIGNIHDNPELVKGGADNG